MCSFFYTYTLRAYYTADKIFFWFLEVSPYPSNAGEDYWRIVLFYLFYFYTKAKRPRKSIKEWKYEKQNTWNMYEMSKCNQRNRWEREILLKNGEFNENLKVTEETWKWVNNFRPSTLKLRSFEWEHILNKFWYRVWFLLYLSVTKRSIEL